MTLAPDHVVVFAPIFPPAERGGGPIRTLGALVDSAPDELVLSVITSDRENDSRARLPVTSNTWSARGRASVYYGSTDRLRLLAATLSAARERRAGVLYVNGFFDPRLSILPQLLYRIGYWGAPLRLVAPRGEFGPAALRRGAVKKRLYLFAYRLLGLHRSVYWHASSEAEAGDIHRLWGARARVIIRENDTALPTHAAPPPAGAPGPLAAIFVGRIVEHKGLAIALAGLRDIPAEHPVRLVVCGPDEDGTYARLCRATAASLPDWVTVEFRGPIAPMEVRGVIADHDLTVMPTAGENFGHVIAEALSVSCPVLCTPFTPWTETLKTGGGVVVADRSAAKWGEVLAAYAALGVEERQRRRLEAGRAYDRWAVAPKGPHVLELLVGAA